MELISKDEVMKLAESGKLLSGSFGERAKDIIESIPTIEERKQGRWGIQDISNIYGKGYRLTCSECGEIFDVSERAFPDERYCRYCGAKMIGE